MVNQRQNSLAFSFKKIVEKSSAYIFNFSLKVVGICQLCAYRYHSIYMCYTDSSFAGNLQIANKSLWRNSIRSYKRDCLTKTYPYVATNCSKSLSSGIVRHSIKIRLINGTVSNLNFKFSAFTAQLPLKVLAYSQESSMFSSNACVNLAMYENVQVKLLNCHGIISGCVIRALTMALIMDLPASKSLCTGLYK